MKLPVLLIALSALLSSATAFAGQRIISIGGDVTEIIYALNAEQGLIARDSTSYYPAAVKALPDVGYMRQLNAEGILSLKPDLVLTTALAQPALVFKQLSDAGVKVVEVTGETTLEAVPKKIRTVADSLQRQPQGEALTKEFQDRLAAIPSTPLPVKVLFILNHTGMTPMAAGQDTAADQMIHLAGGKNAMQGFSRYRPISQEGVIASAPDLLLVTTNTLESLGGVEKLWKLAGLSDTPAGKNQNILIVDDMALLSFGIQTPDALKQLRQALEKTQ